MATIGECHMAMGELVFSFQNLEGTLLEVLCDLIEPTSPNLAHILTNRVSFKNLLVVTLNVARDRKIDDSYIRNWRILFRSLPITKRSETPTCIPITI